MSVTNTVSKTDHEQNVHRRPQWIERLVSKQKKLLSAQKFKTFSEYNDDMIIHSMSDNARYKNLCHFVKFTQMIQKEWNEVTEQDLRHTVSKIMEKHGNNGKETGYSYALKLSLRSIIRFVKTGSRLMPEDGGELKMIKFLKLKMPKDTLTREDLPTDEEVRKIIDACADSIRDKAMFSVHADAGTRVGELLGLRIKDVTVDQYGATIKVDGKTGVRPIRIVKSVPHLTKWINAHPYRDNLENSLWIYIHAESTFGKPINYAGFNAILQKRKRHAGIKKRITSHLFRHKEITDLATNLTEVESRMRHGWDKKSSMPSRYTHLNQEDLDTKMLQIMGVKKKEEKEESIQECMFCKIKYSLETRFCEVCSRPLDVTESLRMEKVQEERTKAMIQEMLRQEHAKKSQDEQTETLQREKQEQQKEIENLKKLLVKISGK